MERTHLEFKAELTISRIMMCNSMFEILTLYTVAPWSHIKIFEENLFQCFIGTEIGL